jgi:hypothetical protein
LYVTVAGIAAPPAEVEMETVAGMIDARSIDSLKVTVTADETPTAVAPAAGATAVTVGAVTSGAIMVAAGDSGDAGETAPSGPLAETVYL